MWEVRKGGMKGCERWCEKAYGGGMREGIYEWGGWVGEWGGWVGGYVRGCTRGCMVWVWE